MEDNYKKLNPDLIEKQILILNQRITERFPNSGILGVSDQLLSIINDAKLRAKEISRPNYYIRAGSFFMIGMLIFGIFYTFFKIDFHYEEINFFEAFGVIEAGVNDLVFFAIFIFFLTSLESKSKRKRALKAMEELRSIAHVIDMHQLNKDPQLLIAPGPATESSPDRHFSVYEMGRYFNYCSEMLSLVAKVSAFYIQNISDQTVLNTATEIEELSSNLSNKVWEKIKILHLRKESN